MVFTFEKTILIPFYRSMCPIDFGVSERSKDLLIILLKFLFLNQLSLLEKMEAEHEFHEEYSA